MKEEKRAPNDTGMNAISFETKASEEHRAKEHILVCLSPALSNERIIQAAAEMANAFQSTFTALFVETSDFVLASDKDKKRLYSNMQLAQRLGAKAETAYGDNIAHQIVEYARISGVSKIVMGRNPITGWNIIKGFSLSEKVLQKAPEIEMHIIPDTKSFMPEYKRHCGMRKGELAFVACDICKCSMVMLLATLIGFLFEYFKLTDANIIAVYILGVMISAVMTEQRFHSIVISFAGVFAFNFFFTEPKFTFAVYDTSYPITFLIMFLVAVISSSLTEKLKRNAEQLAQTAFRTRVLFETNQLLQQAKNAAEIIKITASQLGKLLQKDVIIYLSAGEHVGVPYFFSHGGNDKRSFHEFENEWEVAEWVMKNSIHAGATTDIYPNAKCLYLTIRTSKQTYGVLGIVLEKEALDGFENSILLSILGECALALENVINAREKEEAAIKAKNEQLRADLLRGISHDLRTPLTSISGNASNLMSNWKKFSEETVMQLYTDIYDDSIWLISLVENILSVTRLEEGKIQLHLATELLEDVIQEALQHLDRRASEHSIVVQLKDELLLVKIDARLIVQVLVNLIGNAIKYTQTGSLITISAEKKGGNVIVQVADNGPGIEDEQKEKVFKLFYSDANKAIDSRRSIGIGLALCKSIILAHGGSIRVTDNQPSGAVFEFSLPTEEVQIHE